MKILPHHPKKSQKINPVASKMAIRPWRVAPEEKKSAILRFDMFSICFRLKARLTTPICPKKPRGRAGQLFFFVFMLKWAFLIFSLKPSWGHLKNPFIFQKVFFLMSPTRYNAFEIRVGQDRPPLHGAGRIFTYYYRLPLFVLVCASLC